MIKVAKKILFVFFLGGCFINVMQAQNKIDSVKEKYDFYIETGAMFTPFGPCLGLSFEHPNKALSFLVRSDFWFRFGKYTYVDTNGNYISEKNYSITEYHSLLYFDAEYKFNKMFKFPLMFGAGYGWIYLGNRENYTFDRYSGYGVITLKFRYAYSWLGIEARGNIPIKNNYFTKYNNTADRLFPLQISLLYRFKPKNKKSG